mmetsp:Transcript_7642/g.8813  ORF Transcript_7642/g.8813 Transcript_7642/m.8813 type:complete len:143 (-) Transcript_7642:1004-1432(-)
MLAQDVSTRVPLEVKNYDSRSKAESALKTLEEATQNGVMEQELRTKGLEVPRGALSFTSQGGEQVMEESQAEPVSEHSSTPPTWIYLLGATAGGVFVLGSMFGYARYVTKRTTSNSKQANAHIAVLDVTSTTVEAFASAPYK